MLGDYNNNGTVDAADYVLWRNGGPLQNESDMPGTVNAGGLQFLALPLRRHIGQRIGSQMLQTFRSRRALFLVLSAVCAAIWPRRLRLRANHDTPDANLTLSVTSSSLTASTCRDVSVVRPSANPTKSARSANRLILRAMPCER